MKKILVTGGAGYIGSHMVRDLCDAGHKVAVIDSMVTGYKAAVDKRAALYMGDIRDSAFLDSVFAAEKPASVVHFAASSLVGESMTAPLDYYDNNLGGSRELLAAMTRHGVRDIVFSSTAATYGEAANEPILETAPNLPTNTYGATKLAAEGMIRDVARAHGLQYVILRYFNVAGAHPSALIGEAHNPETHLIPLVLKTALGVRESISIFGTDYPTPDGTCIRDYIHVCDLISAHSLALEYLERGGTSDIFNLGSQTGYSVRQIIDAARAITGRDINVVEAPRRAGDPAVLIASGEKAKSTLGWKPKYDSLEDIVGSAWKWHSEKPNGF